MGVYPTSGGGTPAAWRPAPIPGSRPAEPARGRGRKVSSAGAARAAAGPRPLLGGGPPPPARVRAPAASARARMCARARPRAPALVYVPRRRAYVSGAQPTARLRAARRARGPVRAGRPTNCRGCAAVPGVPPRRAAPYGRPAGRIVLYALCPPRRSRLRPAARRLAANVRARVRRAQPAGESGGRLPRGLGRGPPASAAPHCLRPIAPDRCRVRAPRGAGGYCSHPRGQPFAAQPGAWGAAVRGLAAHMFLNAPAPRVPLPPGRAPTEGGARSPPGPAPESPASPRRAAPATGSMTDVENGASGAPVKPAKTKAPPSPIVPKALAALVSPRGPRMCANWPVKGRSRRRWGAPARRPAPAARARGGAAAAAAAPGRAQARAAARGGGRTARAAAAPPARRPPRRPRVAWSAPVARPAAPGRRVGAAAARAVARRPSAVAGARSGSFQPRGPARHPPQPRRPRPPPPARRPSSPSSPSPWPCPSRS
jgi:hypothetical protein